MEPLRIWSTDFDLLFCSGQGAIFLESDPAEVDEISPAELRIVLGSAIFLFVVVTNFIFLLSADYETPSPQKTIAIKAKEDVTANYVHES